MYISKLENFVLTFSLIFVRLQQHCRCSSDVNQRPDKLLMTKESGSIFKIINISNNNVGTYLVLLTTSKYKVFLDILYWQHFGLLPHHLQLLYQVPKYYETMRWSEGLGRQIQDSGTGAFLLLQNLFVTSIDKLNL